MIGKAQQIVRGYMIILRQRHQMAQRQRPLAQFVIAVDPLVNTQQSRHLLLRQIMILAQIFQSWDVQKHHLKSIICTIKE